MIKNSIESMHNANFRSYKHNLVQNKPEHISGINNPGFVSSMVNLEQTIRSTGSEKNDTKFETNMNNDVEKNKANCSSSKLKASQESEYHALKQLLIPFLIAGNGSVFTGLFLAHLQTWQVFQQVPELYILVPALLGLKGNVEMTLASRLSTHLNLGNMEESEKKYKILTGNVCLVQCQASGVGFVASLITVVLTILLSDNSFNENTLESILVLTSSSVLTANVANLILGSLMISVIIVAKRFKLNPDNIATPIAASCGDLTTMVLLAYISQFFYSSLDYIWLHYSSLIILLLLTPMWAFIANSIEFTRKILISGWFPILSAMLIQLMGGLIMEYSLSYYARLATFQPIINGKTSFKIIK